jgi:hypothetical protein
MTPDQVVSASEGKAHISAGTLGQQMSKLTVGAEGSHTISGFQFPTVFYFNPEGLQRVQLEGQGAACYLLERRLVEQYGNPFGVDNSNMAIVKSWKDQEGGNRLRYMRIGDDCDVSYTPAATKSDL